MPVSDLFDPGAVRRAYTRRAERNKIPLWDVDPVQIHRDLYPGAVVGGATFRFVTKTKKTMLKELIWEAIERRIVETPCDLMDINPARILEDVYGKNHASALTAEQNRQARELVHEAWYDMLIDEGIAQRQDDRAARGKRSHK